MTSNFVNFQFPNIDKSLAPLLSSTFTLPSFHSIYFIILVWLKRVGIYGQGNSYTRGCPWPYRGGMEFRRRDGVWIKPKKKKKLFSSVNSNLYLSFFFFLLNDRRGGKKEHFIDFMWKKINEFYLSKKICIIILKRISWWKKGAE